MGGLVKININNEEVIILMVRQRSQGKSTSSYKRLVQALLSNMTDVQINTVIKRYPKPIILFDDIVHLFKYHGLNLNSDETRCICGVKIKYNHLITNIDTNQCHIIGSTCCDTWSRNSYISYTDTQKTKVLYTMFQILKAYTNRAIRMNFGKYKGRTVNWILKYKDRYCRWLVETGYDHALVTLIKIKKGL